MINKIIVILCDSVEPNCNCKLSRGELADPETNTSK